MAKIISVYGGRLRHDWGEWPWHACVQLFELDVLCRTEERPRFEPSGSSSDPEALVVYLDRREAALHSLQPGYFVSPLDGLAAMARLDGERGSPGSFSFVSLYSHRLESRERHVELVVQSRLALAESRDLLRSTRAHLI